MSNLTDLLPAGAGGKQVDFVASGTIGNGVTVGLNSDGTVTAVASDGTPQETGTPVTYYNEGGSGPRWGGSAYDSTNNRVIIAFRDEGGTNDGDGIAVVGTVSGTSISFGSPVIFNNASTFYASPVFDSNSNKVIIAYRNSGNSNYGTAIVGTVSGTSISFGTAVIFNSASTNRLNAVYDVNADKTVIAYTDSGNSNYGTAIVGTVSGTTISFGSETVFESAGTAFPVCAFDSANNKIVIAYGDDGNASAGTAIVGTVSGTSISFGSPTVFTTWVNDPVITFDSTANKIVIAYRDSNNSNYGTAIVGTVSGTSISFGTSVVFNTATTTQTSISFDSSANKVVVSYMDSGNSNYGTSIVGTVSGTSISFGSSFVFETATSQYTASTFDSTNNKVVINYTASSTGKAFVLQNESTNSADFIGISDAAISDTASGSVTIKGGISTNVTGLTPNSTYYVQTNGTLSTTVSSVLAGKALSSTSINLDYTT